MYEVSEINEKCFKGYCFEDDFAYKGTSLEEVKDIMENHEQELKDLAIKEQKWLLEGDVRNKLIQLNENIDSLIEVAHETYMSVSDRDFENKARLDGQIRAYWNVKSMVEDILEIK